MDNPHVARGELHGRLSRGDKIKLRQQSARLICSVEDDHLLVTVVTVDKREDGVVCQSALARQWANAQTLASAPSTMMKK